MGPSGSLCRKLRPEEMEVARKVGAAYWLNFRGPMIASEMSSLLNSSTACESNSSSERSRGSDCSIPED